MKPRRQRRWRPRLAAGALALGSGLLAVVVSIGAEAFSRAELHTPPPTLIVTDRNGYFLTEVGDAAADAGPFDDAQGFWPMDPVPRRVAAVTLVAEDRRFDHHAGVDAGAVARAAVQNVRGGRRISGASTIAMQVARMQDPGPRTYRRKVMEAATALALVRRHGKDAVLAHYLRIAPYGNRMRGYAYAARGYFDKPVADLSWAEAALLAALPQSPARMDPYDPEGRRRAVARGRWILDGLLETGALSAEDHAVATRQIERLRLAPRRRRPEEAMHAILRLTHHLDDPEVRRRLAHRPIVESTLDLDLQRELLARVGDAVWAWQARGAGNAAVIVVDLAGNGIVSYVGSADYFNAHQAGSIDYAAVPRSPGSTLKPLLFALGLERGTLTPASILDDLPHTPEPVANADRRFLGPLLPRVALGNSRNVPAMRLQAAIGLDEVHAFLRHLDLHDGATPPEHYGAGLSLGALPVTLEALVRAYGALAHDGRLGDLVWTHAVPAAAPRRVLSEESARQIGMFLSDPMARLPSFPRMGALEYPFPVAVKTGTASGYRDAWTVAYSRRHLIGVWVGHPDWRPMNQVSGASSAAALAREIFLDLEAEVAHGLSGGAFPAPEGTHPTALCARTGRLATEACEQTRVEWLRAEDVPTGHCHAHMTLPVDRETGRVALVGTPPDRVERRTFVDLGPRYAAWSAAAGLPPPPSVVLGVGSVPQGARAVGWTPTPQHPAAGWPPALPEPALTIAAPVADRVVFRDPETPAEHATLALEAVVDPPVPQVVWYVDGAPFAVVDHPYTARWPLRPGERTFQVRLPEGTVASAPVRVVVR
jgi:penicillin-binding protein 1C